jgi:hypothetical protein
MRDALLGLIGGFRVSQMIAVVARIRIADHLRDGPRSAGELAQVAGCDADALYRVMRALASIGVFAEDGSNTFRLTPMGNWLRSDVPGSIRVAAEVVAEDWMWRPWGALTHSVTTGETAFHALYGTDTWTWFGEHRGPARMFDELMDTITLADAEAIVGSFDFAPYRTIVDVAGGRGVLLAEILRRNPGARGLLFNLPEVIESAAHTIDPDFGERLRLVPGDFFQAVPPGGDLYILKNILHDWPDGDAVKILDVCRAAMTPAATLMIVEHFICAPNERCSGKVGDVQMMVRTGGRNRSISELGRLLTAAGFQQVEARPTAGGPDLLLAARLEEAR